MYIRVKYLDPATARLVVIPIETSGLEPDSVLITKPTVAAVFAGTTQEQTSMGRITLASADLLVPAPDNTNNRYDVYLPQITWVGATGNPISRIMVCYEPDITSPSDANKLPLSMFDRIETPDGSDITVSSGVFLRAREP